MEKKDLSRLFRLDKDGVETLIKTQAQVESTEIGTTTRHNRTETPIWHQKYRWWWLIDVVQWGDESLPAWYELLSCLALMLRLYSDRVRDSPCNESTKALLDLHRRKDCFGSNSFAMCLDTLLISDDFKSEMASYLQGSDHHQGNRIFN